MDARTELRGAAVLIGVTLIGVGATRILTADQTTATNPGTPGYELVGAWIAVGIGLLAILWFFIDLRRGRGDVSPAAQPATPTQGFLAQLRERSEAQRRRQYERGEAIGQRVREWFERMRGGGMSQEEREARNVFNVTATGDFGVAIGQVNINQAPEPRVKQRPLFANRQQGDQYLSVVEVEIDSPYPPGNLQVVARAPSIQSVEANAQRSGLSMAGHTGVRDGWAFTNIPSPWGVYHVAVVTAEPEENISVECQFS